MRYYQLLKAVLSALWGLPETLRSIQEKQNDIERKQTEQERSIANFVELADAFVKSSDESLSMQTMLLKSSVEHSDDGLTNEELDEALEEVNSQLAALRVSPIVGKNSIQQFYQEELTLQSRQKELLAAKRRRLVPANVK